MPERAPPYVFSRDELQRLFGAVDASRRRPVQLDADTLRMLLLLLYGAGLRLGEAQRLTFGDVDLDDAVLTIRDTKFFGRRLVPVGSQLAGTLRRYVASRRKRPLPKGMASPVLAGTATARRWSGEPFRERSPGCSGRPGSSMTGRMDEGRHARRFIHCATRRPFTGLKPGTGRAPTCSACCRRSPPGLATPISTERGSTSR